MVWLETLPDDWWIQYESMSLSSDCIRELNTELLFLIRSLLLETRTYARVCKRICLRCVDFHTALEARNVCQNKNIMNNFKQPNEETISLLSILQAADQSSSTIDGLELTIHWLAIDGEQPIIIENPPPTFSQDDSFEIKQSKPIHNNNNNKSLEVTMKSPLLEKLFIVASTTQRK